MSLEGALGVAQSSQVGGLKVGLKEAVKDEGMIVVNPFLAVRYPIGHLAAPLIECAIGNPRRRLRGAVGQWTLGAFLSRGVCYWAAAGSKAPG